MGGFTAMGKTLSNINEVSISAYRKNKYFVKNLLILFFCSLFLLGSCASMPAPKESLIDLIRAGKSEEVKERFSSESVNMTDENGNSLLHIAAEKNDHIIIRFLLSMNANIEAKNNFGQTPLLFAINAKAGEAARILAEEGANIFAKDNEECFPLESAKKFIPQNLIINSLTIKQKDEEGNTALHYAVNNLDLPLVNIILETGTPKTVKNNKNKTPLHSAYNQQNEEKAAEIAFALIIAGIEPEGKGFKEFETATLARNFSMHFGEGNTLLHIFARKGSLGFIRFLLNKNVPINSKNAAGSTAMHEAVRQGQIEAAAVLLTAGADLNDRDASGNTVLHLVMPEASRSKLFDQLLTAGVNPNIKDNYGETPLHIAARIGMNEKIISALIKNGADVNERNKKGQTPLLLAIERNQGEQAKILVEYGSDIHAEDNSGETAFTQAVYTGLSMVQNLINEKNCGTRDSNGSTPLHTAIKLNSGTDIIYYLIEKKHPINTRDKLGNTPLHIAASENYKEAGEILLANNADIFYTNVKGDSPLKIAAVMDAGREEWMINSHTINARDGAGNTPAHLAAEWKANQMLLYLLDKGADINAGNANNETPLFSAVKSDSVETIKILLGNDRGIQADINARDFMGNSIIHAAIKWSAYNSAEFLVNLKTETSSNIINSKNLAGKTVLHEAAKQGNIAFLQMFIRAKADINASDETGCTPLTEAVLTNKTDAVEMLLNNGASPSQQDMYGKTPFHEAVAIGDTKIISMIREAGGNPLASDAYGKTPFLLSIGKGLKIIDIVLGKDKFLSTTDGDSPLHLAVKEHVSAEIMQKILSKGYPVDKRNKNGTTAVLLAIQKGQRENTHLLLLGGADPFIINNQGLSAVGEIFAKQPDFVPLVAEFAVGKTDVMGDGLLHYAAKFANVQIVKSLLSLPGINTKAKNTAGETPYNIAVRWQRKEIADLLK